MTDVAAAIMWREEHHSIAHTHRLDRPLRRGARPLAEVERLRGLALHDFPRYSERLREALRAVPRSERENVILELSLWQSLLHIDQLRQVFGGGDVGAYAAQSAADRQWSDSFLYAIAADEPWPGR